MKKGVTLSVVAITIVCLAASAWFINSHISSLNTQISELQTQNSNLQNQTIALYDQNLKLGERVNELLERLGENYSSAVKVVGFEWIGGFNPIVGVTLFDPINVTIKNDGATTVNGLSLGVRLINKYNDTQIGMSGGTNIDSLQSGETREIETGVYTTIGTNLDEAACVITLKSGSIVLDEWTRNLS